MARGSQKGIALRPVKTANGETCIYARFHIPYRKGNKIAWRRVERSTRTGDPRQARDFAKAVINAAYDGLSEKEEVAKVEAQKPTFAGAALTYMQTSGNTRYMAPLLRYFKTTPLDEFGQSVVNEAAKAIYPNKTPQTWNRQIFTPVIAVLTMAAAEGLCPKPVIKRPKGWDYKPPISMPKDDWYGTVLPHAKPPLRALILLWTLHNLRIQEALDRKPADFDPARNTLIVEWTKNGEPVQLRLSEPVSDAIKAYDWRAKPQLFGTANRTTVYDWIRQACAAAGAPYFNPYALGKHRFASRHLEQGKSLKWVQEAGRWKTIKMVAERYGHLEQRELEKELNEFNTQWADSVGAPKRLSVLPGGNNGGKIAKG